MIAHLFLYFANEINDVPVVTYDMYSDVTDVSGMYLVLSGLYSMIA